MGQRMYWLAGFVDTSRAFPYCWVSRKERVAAFSLRKTPIDADALDYTYRENALAAPKVIQDYLCRILVLILDCFDPCLGETGPFTPIKQGKIDIA